jgi:GTP-binding protein LepA
MESIVTMIPEPKNIETENLNALVFDSYYDPFRGVIIYVRIFSGRIYPGMDIVLCSSNTVYKVLELGYLQLEMVPANELTAGEVGYVIAGIKNIHEVKTGDIIVEKNKGGYDNKYFSNDEIKPFIFAGIYNLNPGDYDNLKIALEKLHLSDASFQYTPVNSDALGMGFHCGFLGPLHLEIVKERLEREYNLNLIITIPNVKYRIKRKNNDEIIEIDNPSRFPQYHEIEYIEEPYVKSMIVTPTEYLSNIVELCKSRRGTVIEIKQLDSNHTLTNFEIPLSEIIFGFYDALKSVSRGYASFDYEFIGYKKSNLVKLEVLVNQELVDTFGYIVHESKINSIANKMMKILKMTIPRQLFNVSLQIRVKNRIILRDDIRALRKDVLAKCYGGDVTRKRKLLEKQKEGKKKMKQFGKVEIPQETFLGLLKINTD